MLVWGDFYQSPDMNDLSDDIICHSSGTMVDLNRGRVILRLNSMGEKKIPNSFEASLTKAYQQLSFLNGLDYLDLDIKRCINT